MTAITTIAGKHVPTREEERAVESNLMQGKAPNAAEVAGLEKGGQLWSWGKGRDGALGLGHCRLTPAPALLPEFEKRPVVYSACGDSFTFAVTEAGPRALWAFGNDQGGLLGLGTPPTKRDMKKNKKKKGGAEAEEDEGMDAEEAELKEEEEALLKVCSPPNPPCTHTHARTHTHTHTTMHARTHAGTGEEES